MAARPRGGDCDVTHDSPGRIRSSGLTYDHRAATRHLRAADPALAAVMRRAGRFCVEPPGTVDPFAYLLRSITFQQLNGTAARAIHQRFLTRIGDSVTPARLLAITPAELRLDGVSASKAASMHDLARHTIDGTVPGARELAALSDAEIVRRLTVIRGIGPWTVHMLLLFQLGRPDVLPTGDFGVREGWRLMQQHESQPTPAQFRTAVEHWRPYRSVGAWYMWRAVDLHRDGRLPPASTSADPVPPTRSTVRRAAAARPSRST